MARRITDKYATRARPFRVRHTPPTLTVGVLPPAVLREIMGGEDANALPNLPPSPPPPDRG